MLAALLLLCSAQWGIINWNFVFATSRASMLRQSFTRLCSTRGQLQVLTTQFWPSNWSRTAHRRLLHALPISYRNHFSFITSLPPRRTITTMTSPEAAGATASTLQTRTNEQESKGTKRPAEDQDPTSSLPQEDAATNDELADSGAKPSAEGPHDHVDSDLIDPETGEPLSKNKLRKLKRQKLFEERKADKKLLRKEKRHAKQERKREAKATAISEAISLGADPEAAKELVVNQNKPPTKLPGAKVPVTVVLDCQYEKYMLDKELVSMASQATRCYSDNRKARYVMNFVVSSFGGTMKERFEKTLNNQHKHWKGVQFTEKDFVGAAHDANAFTAGPQGGEMIPVLKSAAEESKVAGSSNVSLAKPPPPDSKKKAKLAASAPEPELEREDVDKSIVYLTADSPYTLDRLEPNTSYVIGGIIDRNREKGLCYKVARERNVRTAKLPIGEFMVLQSRHVLATNHVMEIMLKYLELGDWGAAFMHVIPTRKGGKLRDGEEEGEGADAGNDAVPRASGAAAATEDEGNLADTEPGPLTEQKDEQDKTTGVDAMVVDSTEPQDEPAIAVEGDNADEGLEKNAMNQRKWSAPPVEVGEVADPKGTEAEAKPAA